MKTVDNSKGFKEGYKSIAKEISNEIDKEILNYLTSVENIYVRTKADFLRKHPFANWMFKHWNWLAMTMFHDIIIELSKFRLVERRICEKDTDHFIPKCARYIKNEQNTFGEIDEKN